MKTQTAQFSAETQAEGEKPHLASHTILPWHIVTIGKRHYLYAERDVVVAVVERQFHELEARANADLIVRAANSHEGLLAACRIALEVIRRHDAGETGCPVKKDTVLASYCGEDCLTDPDAIDGIGDVLAKAVAKAEGAA